MRGCFASCLLLAGAIAAGAVSTSPGGEPPPRKDIVRKDRDWQRTLNTAPRGWDRDYDLARRVMERMLELFPDGRQGFFKTAVKVGTQTRGEGRLQFWIVRRALAAGPKGADLAQLRFALALLHGKY
ncbi:MAG: hypothetical protein ACYTGB_15250, partial [Planctomycetota bacterium]